MTEKYEPLFNAGAAIYDSFTFLRRPAEMTAEKAQLLPGQKVLDIACGSGWATMKATRIVGEQGRVIGIDIADKLLDIARQKAVSSGFVNIEYLEGDVHNLFFNDSCFDSVIYASSLFMFSDIPRAIHECYRVLKTGGTMIFSTFGKNIFQPVNGLLNDRIAKYENNRLLMSAISVTDTPEKCRDIFTGEGFDNIEITEENLVCSFPDKEECWRQISGSLIVRPRLKVLSPDRYKVLKEEILSELEKLDTFQDISVDVPVIISKVTKL
ncbi:MAG: class I SAM-dependent methyltransferase [Dehalococcoidales bacterium]|nr:MAG: class I SAM-dependent methyltransferase [Dehalococcoidales bacterium]